MRLSAAVALGLSTAAMATPREGCMAIYHADVAESAQCGDRASISSCLSRLDSTDPSALEACYTQAGCSASNAATEAANALDRCADLQVLGDLRRREHHNVRAPAVTPGPRFALMGRDSAQGSACFTFDTFQTTNCAVQTVGDKLTTLPCSDIETTTSACKAHWTCTTDSSNEAICMELHNGLDTGGIIVAIVFAAAIVLGIAFLTFMGCKESRQQKRLAARAEATALARAATKKQRNQDRVPLMRQQDGAGMAADPFNDRNTVPH